MSPAQSRAARAFLGWSQSKLAESAGLGLSTIVDCEKERRLVSADALQAIRAALEQAGVQFLADGDVATGPGVALKLAP